MTDTLAPSVFSKNSHTLERVKYINEYAIFFKNILYLAGGAAEAVARWADAVTQLTGFLICHTGALPIQTHFGVAFALSLQKLDQFAVTVVTTVVDACCLTHLK